jgi:hypothetical protein
VTPEEALRDIRGYAAAGRISYSRHARERMVERNVRAQDVRAALQSASRCTATDGGKWRAGGKDLDGDDLDLIVALESGVVVVTVF